MWCSRVAQKIIICGHSLADALARWQAHAENARTVQLAMAPGLCAEEKRAEEFWRNEPRPTFDELMAMR
ncbi:hypothetical protein DCO48_14020 [Pseudomonas sp. SDI]|uniref:hypothetical protein n=1 Tax=Pseudomonas sp. SDI TaxID=2170734 RepID=UPI000DE600EF|nr:hypothetical protein [Pseudomonas sp. SDI]PWB32224.1 hypothetical protein DCO48_14020 [Pseudomonas sp. SDI]